MSEPATAEKLDKTPEVVEQPPEPAKATRPNIGQFEEAQQSNRKWRLNVSIDVKPEQCMDQGFWAHIAALLRPGDEIRVFPDDMAWELVLHVIDAGKSFAHVARKTLYQYATRGDHGPLPSLYKVDWAGTRRKYRVTRGGEDLKDGFATEGLAQQWAKNHEAAINR